MAALLAVVCGVTATVISGEFRISWEFLLFDIPFVALVAVGTAVVLRAWTGRAHAG